MRRTFVRTPQACDPWYAPHPNCIPCRFGGSFHRGLTLSCSRRRKTKCDGIRPRCKRCADRSVPCAWSHPEPPHTPGPISAAAPSPDVSITVASPGSRLGAPAPSPEGLKLCLSLFFDRHFATDFCSFDHRPDFEQNCSRDALLSSAVIALCGRYLKARDAQAFFGLSSGLDASRSCLHEARSLAKASLDQPTGAPMSIPKFAPNIQTH